MIKIKRVYDPISPADGRRILVDRLWPRGLSKEKAALDYWLKELAPSEELRHWFGHDPSRWVEFRQRYFAELDKEPEGLESLRSISAHDTVTLLFAAHDAEHNNAVALKAYLEAHDTGKK